MHELTLIDNSRDVIAFLGLQMAFSEQRGSETVAQAVCCESIEVVTERKRGYSPNLRGVSEGLINVLH